MKPKHGDESTCRTCGEPIKWRAPGGWKHWPGPRKGDRHEALPVGKTKGKR